MADVFVSYQHKDRARIKLLVTLLKRRGLSVWWDPTLVAGEQFGQVIEEEIRKAKCVIVAWSANSINAPWVQDEADRDVNARSLCRSASMALRPRSASACTRHRISATGRATPAIRGHNN